MFTKSAREVATPARIKAALDGKVGHCKRGHGDKRGTWYIGQILHYGLGSGKITKAAARQRLVEAFKAGTLKVPGPILDIEKRLKEDYHSRSGTEQRSRTEKKEVAGIAASHIRNIDIGCSDQEDEKTEMCYSFRSQVT